MAVSPDVKKMPFATTSVSTYVPEVGQVYVFVLLAPTTEGPGSFVLSTLLNSDVTTDSTLGLAPDCSVMTPTNVLEVVFPSLEVAVAAVFALDATVLAFDEVICIAPVGTTAPPLLPPEELPPPPQPATSKAMPKGMNKLELFTATISISRISDLKYASEYSQRFNNVRGESYPETIKTVQVKTSWPCEPNGELP